MTVAMSVLAQKGFGRRCGLRDAVGMHHVSSVTGDSAGHALGSASSLVTEGVCS